MEEDDSQWTTLREKFISVVEPVIASGDENNITTLLSSLSHIYRPAGGIIVPIGLGTDEEKKATEFTCWLISQLLNINNSFKVHIAVSDLLSNIFHLIGTKNPIIFPDFLQELLKIGLEASNVLSNADELPVVHKCFSILLSTISEPSLKPKPVILKNDETLDQLISKIVMVIGNISGDLILYGENFIHEAWLIIGLALEVGDFPLKNDAMKSIGLMLVACQLPDFIERQDFILQLIGGCLISLIKGNFQGPEVDANVSKLFQANLCFTISKLNLQLMRIHPCLAIDVLESIGRFLDYSSCLKNIASDLLHELLFLACNLIEMHPREMQSSVAHGSLEKAVLHNLQLKEVIEVCLKRFVFKELMIIFPKAKSTDNLNLTKKRTLHESEIESAIILASSVSSWWGKIEENMQLLLDILCSEVEYEEFIKNADTFINYMKMSSELMAGLPQQESISIAFLSENILNSVTEIILTNLSQTSNLLIVLKLLSLLQHIVFVNNASRGTSMNLIDLHQTWLALASMPWLANEVQWLDLKVPNIKIIGSIASKAAWTNENTVKIASLPVLALSLKNIAPQWRCHILRSIFKEGNIQVINCVAEWLPMFLHHLPHSSSQSLLGEVIGKLFMSQDPKTLKIVSYSLDILICSILNMTQMKPKEGYPCGASNLTCIACQKPSSNCLAESGRSKQFADQALVQRFLTLAKSSDSEIILNLIHSLPALFRHCNLTSNMFIQILEILENDDEEVTNAFCNELPLFFSNVEDSSESIFDKMEPHLLSFLEKLILSTDVVGKKLFMNQLAVLNVFSCLARKKLLRLSNTTLLLLMKCLVSSDQEISARAHLFVADWAHNLAISPKDIYMKNKRKAAQILSEFLREGDVALIISHFAEVFGWSRITDDKRNKNSNVCSAFASQQMPYLLPPLVIRASRDGKPSILQELSVCVGIRLRDMIIDHFQHILSYVVFNCQAQEKEKILKFISSTTDIEIKQIRKCSVQNQVNELIMGLHDHKEAVLKEFIAMKAIENETKPKVGHLNFITEVAQFLAPRLLGILGFLDGKLVSISTTYKYDIYSIFSLLYEDLTI